LLKKVMAVLLLVCMLGVSALPARAQGNVPVYEPEQIQAQIEEAMAVYSWFTIWPLGGDLNQPSEDGLMYRVLDERYDTRMELAEFALEYFSMEIVTSLFAQGPYYDIDGYLYVDDWFSIMDENISSVEYELADSGEGWVQYRAHVSYLQDSEEGYTESYDFRLEQRGENWIFTEFAFYWAAGLG